MLSLIHVYFFLAGSIEFDKRDTDASSYYEDQNHEEAKEREPEPFVPQYVTVTVDGIPFIRFLPILF